MPATRSGQPALDALRLHSWPGNVRELRHAVTRALLWSEGGVIDHFDVSRRSGGEGALSGTSANNRRGLGWNELAECLTKSGGRLGPAAEAMQISTRTLQRRMRDLGMNIRDCR